MIYKDGKCPIRTWISPKVEIRESSIEGKGMFALMPIKKGEVIIIWGGEYTNKKGAKQAERQGKLAMQWDEDLFSIEERGDDLSYFINHSCDPNIWMFDAFTLVARRNISISEELFADYVLWEADESFVSKWQCRCGSLVCRGKVTGKDWKIPKLQKRYKGHFSPLINKRIVKLKN